MCVPAMVLARALAIETTAHARGGGGVAPHTRARSQPTHLWVGEAFGLTAATRCKHWLVVLSPSGDIVATDELAGLARRTTTLVASCAHSPKEQLVARLRDMCCITHPQTRALPRV